MLNVMIKHIFNLLRSSPTTTFLLIKLDLIKWEASSASGKARASFLNDIYDKERAESL